MEDKRRNAQTISILTLFGIAVGNGFGILIGVVFIPESIGLGLLVGNLVGCIAGLLFGAIMTRREKRE